VSREAWSAMFVTFGLVDWEPPMTIGSAPAGSAPKTITSSEPPNWPWQWTALILAIAAQPTTIPALVSADPSPRPGRRCCWPPRPRPLLPLAAVVLVVGGVGLCREQS
jgi:hypothetical protein